MAKVALVAGLGFGDEGKGMDKDGDFQNQRYEYCSTEHPTVIGDMIDPNDPGAPWVRVWADITMEGTFVVYRRERSK